MATRNTELQFRLTGDPASLLASLEKSRGAALRTYGTLREGVAGANAAWVEAQAKVKGLATELGSMGPPTKRQIADVQAAATAAGKLKDAYLAARDAAARQQQGLRDNSSAISATQQQIKAAADQQAATARSIAAKRAEAAEEQRLAAIVIATRAQMAAAAQAQLQAERRGFDEAAAAAKRLADNQAAAAAWSRQYAAAQLASQDRINAIARRQVQVQQAPAATNTNLGATRAGLTSISQQLAQARNAAAAVVGAQGVGDLVRVIDAYTSFNARLKLATRSSQELEQAQRGLFTVAQRNGVALGDTAQLFVRIADPMRAMGAASSDVLGVVEGVTQSLRLSGASAAESSSAMLQFSQAMGAGTLQGEELNAILENAPRLAKALADGLGVPIGKLKELGAAGSLSSEKILTAFRSQLPQLAREAAAMPVTIGQAVMQVQNAFQRYVGGVDEAAGSSRKLAEGLSWVASNIATVVKAAAGIGTSFALGIVIRSVAALAAAVGAIPTLLVMLAGAGVTAWLNMGDGAGKAATRARSSLAEMTAEVKGFGHNVNEATRDASIVGLTEKIKEAQDKLKGMKLEDFVGEPGKKLKGEIDLAVKALDGLQARKAELATQNLTKEKKDLGLDGLKVDGLNLIDKGKADQLQAFDKLYKAFVTNARDSSGDLVTSYSQVRAAIDNLIQGAKSPAEFDGLISRLSKALKGTIGGGSAPLKAELASLAEARAKAEEKVLADQVAGLQARGERASKYFTVVAEQARIAMEGSVNLARVTAELRNDTKAISADQAAQAQSSAMATQQSAAVQIAMLKKVADQKRAIIDADSIAASRVATDAAIDADRAARTRRALLDAEKLAVAPDSQRAREIAAEEKKIAEDLAKEKKRIADASAEAQGNAARRVADVERSTAQARLEILRASQQEIASKANDALAAYRNYAQQVIQLDRQIVANRLDTASSIEALKRKDMTPGQQADSLRAEMERLRSEEGAAARNGDKTQQQELLNRQKSVAGELGGLSGDGVDQKAMRAEAIANLQRIGDESGTILQAQRAEAAAAAEQQKATYEAMVASIQRLSVEIGKINQGEALKLKAEIDTASVQSAVEAVRQAFANTTFAVRVAATQSAVATGPLDGERRAAGGMMTGPGHDTSDNILTWTSPGEFVVKAAAVRHYGASTLAALNGMNLPRFAAGGLVGGLAIPSAIAERSPDALQPMTLAMPDGRSFDVQARPDVAQAMDRHIRMETLKRGSLR